MSDQPRQVRCPECKKLFPLDPPADPLVFRKAVRVVACPHCKKPVKVPA